MRMLTSNLFLFFINTNRVIYSNISSNGNFSYFSIINIIFIIFRWKPNSNTTMRVFITTSRNTYNPIIYFSILVFFLNTLIRFKTHTTIIIKSLTINIKFKTIINTKTFFPFIKFFTYKYILCCTTK